MVRQKSFPAGSAVTATGSRQAKSAPQGFLRRMRIEHGLIASGMASALASCCFAGFMIVHNTGMPNVVGGEYFTVFAKMDRHLRARNAAILAQAGAPGGDIDPIVTGSITGTRPPDRAAVPLPGFSLREAFDETAMVDSPSGVQVVHVGSTLVGAGRVTAIERRGGRMVVATESGIVVGEAE